jgi:hypothetical protein
MMANTVKVTNEVYNGVKSLIREGNKTEKIAKYYGIATSTVQRIHKSKSLNNYRGLNNTSSAKKKAVKRDRKESSNAKLLRENTELLSQLLKENNDLRSKVAALDYRLYYLEKEDAKRLARQGKKWFNFRSGKES